MTGPDQISQQITAHALQIGDRINTAGFEGEVLSNTPLALRIGTGGLAVVFRYGVVVFLGLTADEEAEFLERLHSRTFGKITPYEEERARVQVARESDEPIPAGGPISVREMSLERLLVVADSLAKSVVLARDEREVTNVFDIIEPRAKEPGSSPNFPGILGPPTTAGSGTTHVLTGAAVSFTYTSPMLLSEPRGSLCCSCGPVCA